MYFNSEVMYFNSEVMYFNSEVKYYKLRGNVLNSEVKYYNSEVMYFNSEVMYINSEVKYYNSETPPPEVNSPQTTPLQVNSPHTPPPASELPSDSTPAGELPYTPPLQVNSPHTPPPAGELSSTLRPLQVNSPHTPPPADGEPGLRSGSFGPQKLFKAAMSFMLSGGTPEDDNAVIEMSLKLATIYAEQNKTELAEHGFRFCLESLQEKLQREEKAEPTGEEAEPTGEEAEPTEQRKDSRLLLGLCFDSRARYRHHDDALQLVQHAVELSRSVTHPDLQVLLGNMAGILLHTGRLEDSVRCYQEALSLALQAKDQEAVHAIQEGLKEVKKRREEVKKKKEEEEEKEEKKEEED
ncbi:Tetratricopeptide repeat protein 19 mitochondrial [Dissostichus eleginoides]|uniref:Tetratricopeptide repeat protein 19 mitochondrial n=1 Tax=Dissostichus eleginoides TaxID=100907 RepID=A0AAD9B453_DISEL|nr:Tetratricopeptide repeat protein 19 mitochondrial [Dissostichus eleginoides]